MDKNLKLVIISWLDACQTEKYHPNQIMPIDERMDLVVCESIGFIVEETESRLSIAQTMSKSGWYRDIINIPKMNITNREALKKDL